MSNKKLHVVFLDFDDIRNPLLGAGQARTTLEIGKRLTKKGHFIEVISSKYPGSKDRSENGILYRHIGLGSNNIRLNNLIYIFVLPFAVKSLRADIIVECFTAPISTLLTPLWTKIPVIAMSTSFDAERISKLYHLPFFLVEKFGAKLYRYFIAYTKEISSKMKKLNPKVMTKIIPVGVDRSFLRIKRKKAKYILFLGRMDINQKGIDFLLQAYAKVKSKLGLPLWIAGNGPDEKKIKQLIGKFHLNSRVKMIGPVYGKEKMDLMSKAIYAAFPSRNEGFSLVALEALASGLPLICFDISAIKWTGKGNSLKAKPFDIDQFADYLVKGLNKKLNDSMSKNGRLTAEKYTWNQVAYAYEKFFYQVI